MPLLDMQDYRPAGRRFWWLAVASGFAALAWAVVQVALLPRAVQAQVAGLVAVTAMVGLFPVRIPGTRMSVAGGEIFIFLALLLHGPAAAILACALEGSIGSWRTSKRWTSRIGTPAILSAAMFACAIAFEAARGAIASAGLGVTALLPTLVAFGLLYYAANTLLTSMMFALKRGDPIRPWQWWTDLGWIGLAYMTSGIVAGLLYATFERFGVGVLVVSAPMIAMFLYALHSHFERREAAERHVAELQASESRFHSAFAQAAVGMAIVSTEGRFLQVNRALCEMLGRTSEELLAADLRGLIAEPDAAALQSALAALLAGEMRSVQDEVRALGRGGPEVWMALSVSLARDWHLGTRNLIVQAHDVTARRRAEAELYHNAYHDSLTGLPNRKCFGEHLGRAIGVCQRNTDRHFAVMYLDFDRFKIVNDSLGHRAGDELLMEMGRRLVTALRPGDIVARLGGDEFAVLVEDLENDRQALDLAERLQAQLSRPVVLSGIDISVTASIGITFSSNGYASSEQVVRDADIAMYQAKSRGKAQYALFDASLHRLVSGQLRLESELRQALREEQLCVVYQPIHDVREGGIAGFEALVRWRHPEHGILQPGAFIPIAEETGLIVPLGHWVMAEACRQLRAWKGAPGSRRLRMSVNVSSLELRHPAFVDNVRRCIESSGIEPSQLLVEVTETVLMDGVTRAVATLRALRELGVGVAIDDFGIGYSSLAYLTTLPVDVLKVDRCFIGALGTEDEGGEVARAIFKLGQALGKEVFAEGVETEEQLAMLREIGCNYAQGYLFAHPLEAHLAGQRVPSSLEIPRDLLRRLQGLDPPSAAQDVPDRAG